MAGSISWEKSNPGSSIWPAISAEELCGSMSTTRARPLASAVTAARASASVVLTTPPFWLGTATIHGLAILASVTGGAGAVSAAVIAVAPFPSSALAAGNGPDPTPELWQFRATTLRILRSPVLTDSSSLLVPDFVGRY